MARIDELVRASLRERAGDVEPTPALWNRVDGRLRRRHRRRVAAWGLVGVTSVLAAVAVVPDLLTDDDTRIPEIVPIDPALPGDVGWPPMAASTPDGFGMLDVAAGSFDLRVEGTDLGRAGVAVRRGSTIDVHDLALVSAEGLVTVVSEDSFVTLDDPGSAATDTVPSVAWAGDAPWLAIAQQTADGTRVSVRSAPTRPATATDEPAELAVLPAGTRVLDWAGPTRTSGDRSRLLVLEGEQLRVHELERSGDGWVLVDTSDALEGVRVLAGGFVADTAGNETALHTLVREDGRVALRRDPVDGGPGSSAFLDVLDDADTSELWVQVRDGRTLLGDGQDAWVVDFDDGFGGSLAVGRAVSRAGLLATGRQAAPEPTPGDPAAEDPLDAPSREAALPGPVALADGRDLVLLTADGPVTIATLPAEGESLLRAVAVRPGSDVDDLVVVSLTEAEGFPDLRWTEYVDGELRVSWETFPPGQRPGAGQGTPPAVSRPVWSPDGDSLAWLERQGAELTVRVVGWGDGPGTGDPATDNASFSLGAPAGDLDLRLQDWILLADSPGEQVTALRLLDPAAPDGARALQITRGPDGAWFLAASSALEPLSIEGDGPILAFAGRRAEAGAEPRWVVRPAPGGVAVADLDAPAAAPVVVQTERADDVVLRSRGAEGGLLVATLTGSGAWWVPVDGEPRALPPAGDLDWVR